MANKININTFVTLFKNKQQRGEDETFVKEHITDRYVPLEEKQAAAQRIVDASSWVTDTDDHKTLRINSVAQYMLTAVTYVDLYTDIERQKGESKVLEDFNTLNELGIFDMIVKNVSDREMKEFDMVLKMTANDLITNEYENHAFISKQVERFGNLIGVTLAPVIDKIDVNQVVTALAALTENK